MDLNTLVGMLEKSPVPYCINCCANTVKYAGSQVCEECFAARSAVWHGKDQAGNGRRARYFTGKPTHAGAPGASVECWWQQNHKSA